MLCRFHDALDAWPTATDNKDRRFFQAMCYKRLRQYDKAVEELDRAKDRGGDALAVDMQFVEAMALGGNLDAADKALAQARKSSRARPSTYTPRAWWTSCRGLASKAGGGLREGRHDCAQPRPSTFRLAYYYDLHGDEDQAIELYRQCTSTIRRSTPTRC